MASKGALSRSVFGSWFAGAGSGTGSRPLGEIRQEFRGGF
jgi:hypothetical protein